MNDILNKIESTLREFFENTSITFLGVEDAESRLVQQLITAMQATMQEDEMGTSHAPHIYSLSVPYQFLEEVRSNQSLLTKLGRNLKMAGDAAGLSFAAPVSISVFPDSDLQPGQFNIRAIWDDDSLARTAPTKILDTPAQLRAAAPKSFLIVGGTEIFPIESPEIRIGRQLENDLVINDPRVSRKHAQIKIVKGRHILFDLDSSGGTFINTKKIQHHALYPGDLISLAGVPLIYGQDYNKNLTETEEYSPQPADNSSDETTTSHLDLGDHSTQK